MVNSAWRTPCCTGVNTGLEAAPSVGPGARRTSLKRRGAASLPEPEPGVGTDGCSVGADDPAGAGDDGSRCSGRVDGVLGIGVGIGVSGLVGSLGMMSNSRIGAGVGMPGASVGMGASGESTSTGVPCS